MNRSSVRRVFEVTILIAGIARLSPAMAESIVLDGGGSVAASADKTGEADAEAQAELTDEQRDAAKTHFENGSRHFADKEYKEAIANFQKAYAIVHSPEILYNIGRCHEMLGQEQEAIYNYEMYLRLYPNADDVTDVKHRIAVLKDVKAAESFSAAPLDLEDKEPEEPEELDELDEEEGDIPEDHWYTGLRIGGELGVTVPFIGPWKRVVVPAYLTVNLPLTSWLHLTANGILGVGASKDDENDPDQVKGIVGILLGFRFMIALSERFELFFKLGLNFTGLSREHYNRVTMFLGGQVAPGFTVAITSGWRFVFEAMTDAGVIFPGVLNTIDAWGSKGLAKPTVATGGMVGMEYEF